MKRLLSVQDISCFGKCSLTVALPIISAMGAECVVLPTAILSTHTGAPFTGYTFRDLTEDMSAIADHWEKIGLRFDALTSGYLSPSQVPIVNDLFARFSDSALKIIDPVMGDHGQFYSGFDRSFASQMKTLCKDADYIIPNLTEVSFLLDEEVDRNTDEASLKALLPRLCKEVGCRNAVITGARPSPRLQGAIAYSVQTGEYTTAYNRHIEGQFHGTGDIFAAVFSGALTMGLELQKSLQIAVDFTLSSIEKTIGDNTHYYSVKFEQALPELINMMR